jgi:serralysin
MGTYTDSATVAYYDMSGNAFIDGLIAEYGYKWGTVTSGKTTISFSLPWTTNANALFEASYSDEPTAELHFGLDETQKGLLDTAFQLWENVANLSFHEVFEADDGVVGDIRVAFSSALPETAWGWANYPWPSGNQSGDIWINATYDEGRWDEGTYNLKALVHEIGHAIGLKHPFEDSLIPDGFDNRRYTVMSYTDPETIWWWNPERSDYDYLITGPMVYDIKAIQYLYGANMSYHTGNDNYAFSSDRPFYQAIWDAGGTDTINLTGFTKACEVNLIPGSYSTLGFNDLDIEDGLGIAFDCFIENAKGGSGDDRLTGNAIANTLVGNAGADVLSGLEGKDTLNGGTGADQLYGGDGSDSLLGGAGNDKIVGRSGADSIVGGSGKDTMTGGIGIDRFTFDDADFAGRTASTADRIMDFSHAQGDRIHLGLVDANTTGPAGVNEAFNFRGTKAFGHQAGELRYQQISGNTYVQGDTNGDAIADFWIRLDGPVSLLAGDFFL